MILMFPISQHTAQDEARDSERSDLSPSHKKAHDSEKSSPDPQPLSRLEAQDSAEKPSLGPQPPTLEEPHASDISGRPPSCSKPPIHEGAHSSEKSSHSTEPPTHEQEQHTSVKGPKRKTQPRAVQAKRWPRDEESRRLENERRLEGQRLEYERKIEARRKAEEAAAVARAKTEVDERSTNEGKLPQRLSESEELRVRQRKQQQKSFMEENVKAECREDVEGSPTTAIKIMDDDQKVHNDDDAETVGAPGPRVLEPDIGATCLAIADNEHFEAHLVMIAHVSYSFLSIVRLGI